MLKLSFNHYPNSVKIEGNYLPFYDAKNDVLNEDVPLDIFDCHIEDIDEEGITIIPLDGYPKIQGLNGLGEIEEQWEFLEEEWEKTFPTK